MLGSLLLAGASFAPTSSACSFTDGCPWDKLSFACLSGGRRDILVVEYTQITHYSGAAGCGNLLLEKDIGGGNNTAPYLAYLQAETGKLYALVMIDPDADLPNNGDGSADVHAAPSAPEDGSSSLPAMRAEQSACDVILFMATHEYARKGSLA